MGKGGKKKTVSQKGSILRNISFSKNKPKKEANYGPIIVERLSEEDGMENTKAADDIKTAENIHESENSGNTASDIQAAGSSKKNNAFSFEPNGKYFTVCVYALGTIAVGALIIYAIMHIGAISSAIKELMRVLSSFIVAFFIAFILNPLVGWFDSSFFEKALKIKKPGTRKLLSIAAAYILVIGLVVVGIMYVIPQIAASITELVKQQEGIYKEAMDFISNIEEKFPMIDFGIVEEKLELLWPELINYATNFVKGIVPRLFNIGISIAKAAINILLSIAISIYMLYDKRDLSKILVKVLYAILPVNKASETTQTLKECGSIFTSFVVGKAIDSLIIGMMCYIILSIIGLDYAVLLSVIVGVTNMIPYFGPFIGAVPGVLLFLCINPVDSLIFAIAILALQQFDGWILGPKILGDSTGLTPLWVIFGITVGGAYAGVIGMFLGVPVVAVVSFLLSKSIDKKLERKNVSVK